VLQQKGWWGPGVSVDPVNLEAKVVQQGSLRRLQTIYRTNLQSAYMAGRHRQALEQIDRAPWAQYLAVRDNRTRPAHAALHGQVFRLDSPAWAAISPPNGYSCRCRARYLSDRELADRGLKPAEDVRILEREPPGTRPIDPLTGETPGRWLQRGVSVPDPLNPGERLTLWADPGWDHLPGSDGAERMLVDKLMAKATQLSDGIREALDARLVAPREALFGLVRPDELSDLLRRAGGLLTDEEAEAASWYLGSGYKRLNRALRGLPPPVDHQEAIVERLTRALDKLPRNDSTALTRVMGGVKADVDAFCADLAKHKGNEVSLPNFLSTSKPGGRYNPGSVKLIMRIKAKVGSANSADVSMISDLPEEREILYKPGTRFKVLRIKIGKGDKPHEIDLEEL